MSKQPQPCHFCGEPAYLEMRDGGFWWLGCLNDDCVVQPHMDNNDVPTAEEAVAIWNGERAKPSSQPGADGVG